MLKPGELGRFRFFGKVVSMLDYAGAAPTVQAIENVSQTPLLLIRIGEHLQLRAALFNTRETHADEPQGTAFFPSSAQQRRDQGIERTLEVGRGRQALAMRFLGEIRITYLHRERPHAFS